MAGEYLSGPRPLAVLPTLKRIGLLQSNRSYRDKHGLYFVEGVRNFISLMDQGHPVNTVVYSERLLTAPIARKLVRKLKRDGVPFVALSPEQFRSFSRSERASGVGAIVPQEIMTLPRLQPNEFKTWIVLETVRLPGNFGTLVRTAAAVGGVGFILLGNRIDPFDPGVIRASMGAFFGQTFVRSDFEGLRQWVQAFGLPVVGASPEGPVTYDQAKYTQPTVLMLGTERTGLSNEQRSLCTQLVRIPMAAQVDSLNLGVAGSLLLYEVARASPP